MREPSCLCPPLSIFLPLLMSRPISPFRSIFRHYYDLGVISFGGPAVHVIILRRRFVDVLKWLDERTFLDLFSLGNALPGPGSTQLAFSIAVVTHGIGPGLLAFLLWSFPGAIGMTAVGAGITKIPDQLPGIVWALLTGLNAAAVGLIALAAYQLGTAAGTDRLTLLLIWLGASFGICYHAPWMYPTLIAAGGVATLLWDQRRKMQAALRRLGSRRGGQEELTLETMSTQEQGQNNAGRETGRTSSSALVNLSEAPTGPSDTALQPASPQGSTVNTVDSVLKVVSTIVAVLIILAFVLLLTTTLAARTGLKNAGKSVPRGLDVRVPSLWFLTLSSLATCSSLGRSSLAAVPSSSRFCETMWWWRVR